MKLQHPLHRPSLLMGMFLIVAFISAIHVATADDSRPDAGTKKPLELKGELGTKPSEDAVMLFGVNTDGDNVCEMLSMSGSPGIDWPIEDGALVSTRGKGRTNHLVSKLHFRDAQIHVEFMLPEGDKACNSGIYIHGNYELQIYNSHGVDKLTQQEMGAVYGFSEPMVNAAKQPGQWQAYDITYRAPRRDADQKIIEEGVITAWLNGQQVQKDTRLGEPRSNYHPFRYGTTPYLKKIGKQQKSTSVGPVFLQDHDAKVRFRNVWVRPLDDRAFEYVPKE